MSLNGEAMKGTSVLEGDGAAKSMTYKLQGEKFGETSNRKYLYQEFYEPTPSYDKKADCVILSPPSKSP